ncbi:MAG: hypothetical protein WCJ30_28570 [Deltaproteobacteria bacterium]
MAQAHTPPAHDIEPQHSEGLRHSAPRSRQQTEVPGKPPELPRQDIPGQQPAAEAQTTPTPGHVSARHPGAPHLSVAQHVAPPAHDPPNPAQPQVPDMQAPAAQITPLEQQGWASPPHVAQLPPTQVEPTPQAVAPAQHVWPTPPHATHRVPMHRPPVAHDEPGQHG